MAENLPKSSACDYFATMDDDDVYAPDYLAQMHERFFRDPRLLLVKFQSFVGLQMTGAPPVYA